MKKIINDIKTGEITEVELTAEEEAQRQTDLANAETLNTEYETARQSKADLKASAKAKLIAGEALTEEEADTIVL
tara:strand:- start:249 stop:473 length:225 start_codon:yes stop_codon:yes gene_type:complete